MQGPGSPGTGACPSRDGRLYLPRQVNGNQKLEIGLKAKNKALLREAVDLYTQGVNERSGNAQLDAVLLSNRAHVHSLLGARWFVRGRRPPARRQLGRCMPVLSYLTSSVCVGWAWPMQATGATAWRTRSGP